MRPALPGACLLIAGFVLAHTATGQPPSSRRELGSSSTSSAAGSSTQAPEYCLPSKPSNRSMCEQLADGTVHPHSYTSMIWLFFVIITAGVMLRVTSRFEEHLPIPYTSTVMWLGVILGVLYRATDCNLGYLSQSMYQWQSIDSHLILFVFLPALLFADSFQLNFHLVKQCFWQCLLLATIGVLIGTLLTATASKYLLPYGFSWEQSLMLGAILSATDPVAVVGLLKSLGASPVLTMQIAGESLFNDGVAIVLFVVFRNLIQQVPEVLETNSTSGRPLDGPCLMTNSTPGGAMDAYRTIRDGALAAYTAETFAKMFFGGLLVGVVSGGICLFLVLYTDNHANHTDSQLQIVFTISVAYLSYLVGEGVLHFSGVLSTVFAGILVGSKMWPGVVDKTAMEQVWHTMEFIMNTVLFGLSGQILGSLVYESWSNPAATDIEAKDILYVLVLYLLCIVIRAVMLAVLFVPLKLAGTYGTSVRECAFMCWGGLRGAVGLALALEYHNWAISNEKDEHRGKAAVILFLVGVIALLTITLQAPLSGWVLRALGLLHDNKHHDAILDDVTFRLQKEAAMHLKHLAPKLYKELASAVEHSEKKHRLTHSDAFKLILSEAQGLVLGGDLNTYAEARRRFDEERNTKQKNKDTSTTLSRADYKKNWRPWLKALASKHRDPRRNIDILGKSLEQILQLPTDDTAAPFLALGEAHTRVLRVDEDPHAAKQQDDETKAGGVGVAAAAAAAGAARGHSDAEDSDDMDMTDVTFTGSDDETSALFRDDKADMRSATAAGGGGGLAPVVEGEPAAGGADEGRTGSAFDVENPLAAAAAAGGGNEKKTNSNNNNNNNNNNKKKGAGARGGKYRPSRNSITGSDLPTSTKTLVFRSNDRIDKIKMRTYRLMFLGLVRSEYWSLIKKKIIPDENGIAQHALDSIDVAQDAFRSQNHREIDAMDASDVVQPSLDWKHMRQMIKSNEYFRNLLDGALRNVCCCGPDRRMRRQLALTIKENRYYLTFAYIMAHRRAQKLLKEYTGESEGIDSPEEEKVVLESKMAVWHAKRYLDEFMSDATHEEGFNPMSVIDVSDAAPHSSTSVYDMISHIIAKQLATATIYFTMYEVHHFELKGLLTPQEASRLQEELGTRLTHASRSFSKIGPLSRREHRKLLHNRTRSILEGDLQSLGPSGRSSVDDEDEADSGSGEDEKE